MSVTKKKNIDFETSVTSGLNVIKLFSLSLKLRDNKLEGLVLSIFIRLALFLKVMLIELGTIKVFYSSKLRPDRPEFFLPRTNTLAYSARASMMIGSEFSNMS